MKEIQLTRGMKTVVDDEDFEVLSRHKWHAFLSKKKNVAKYYAARFRRVSEKEVGSSSVIFMHRVLLGAKRGEFVDHRDGDGLNNLRSNLRIATHQQNCANKRFFKTSKFGFRGVYKSNDKKKGFLAKVIFKGRKFYLGSFSNAEDAARAYDAKAKELNGEFAVLNF